MVRKKFLSLGVALCMTTSILFTSALPAFAHEAPWSETEFVHKGEPVYNHNFENGVGLPWHVVESAPGKASYSIKEGAYTIKIENGGQYRWDVQFRHRGLNLKEGHKYTLKFTVTADKACKIYPKVGSQGEMEDPTKGGQKGYVEVWNYNQQWAMLDLSANTPKTVEADFTPKFDVPVGEIAFHLAGENQANEGITFKFSDMYLDDSEFEGYETLKNEPAHKIKVNQLGYYPGAEKKATYVTSSASSQKWVLKDKSGKEVANGTTTPFGADKDSGDSVQIIDFSKYTTPGKDYKLYVGSDFSYAFDIDKDIYTQGKYDAFRYFYHARSGTPIEMPYAGSKEWERPAGHTADTTSSDVIDGKDYTGGWYDAGDHGKYVVNGGISLWTLLNQYERSLYVPGAAKYGDDKKNNIPETGNGVPDILDEARWEMEWMLKMQESTGMVHHKLHDKAWTALGVPPDKDTQPRVVKPVSVTATLNLAATAAQAARIWKTIDPTFSKQCLDAAKSAWKAALANPTAYASMTDSIGGGAYGDTNAKDDFYWAGCELYATTSDAEYLNYIKGTDYYQKEPTNLTGGEDQGLDGCFDWGNTAGLGTITLALVKGDKASQASIKKAADAFMATEAKQGYGITINQQKTSDPINGDGSVIMGYPWGSNSFVMNQAIVMAYASDFSKMDNKTDDWVKYFNGAAEALDYLMGRNPLTQCYVTGWGSKPLQNPHHRFFSYQCDNTLPKAPAGFISGGPNSGLVDPWVKGSGWKPGGFPPQKCFMDNIEAWSVNEVTINWNAPLAWTTAYMDDVGPQISVGPGPNPTLGDVNNDGHVDVFDATLVKAVVLKKKDKSSLKAPQNGDMNNDGEITGVDYMLIKKKINSKN